MASSETTQTVITIEGNKDPISFTDLSLDERVLDTNHFSFFWTPEGNDGSLSAIVQFKDKNLSKEVTIKFNNGNAGENHSFKGIITQINSKPNSDMHVGFQLSGSGIFCKINGKIECNSFYQKTLTDIINAVGKVSGSTLLVNATKESGPLHYTVQYNQTAFDFIKMLAIRHGEWMYYTGDKLVFGGKPSDAPIKMKAAQDLSNINIYAHIAKANDTAFGFDTFKGQVINGTTQTAAPSGSALLAAGGKGGGNVFTNSGTGTYFSGAATQEMLDTHNKLQQQSTTAGSVFLSASSHNSKLTVGSIIAVTDAQDSAGKHFIIVEIHHAANNNHGYSNHFTAVPAEVEVPHYTNPSLCPRATTQPALVVENEDKDGHDRIKVRFPWMKKNETSPWIQVLTPHAGKNKGFRWLPEKDEEVMIDFIDNNAERPIMVGAMFTEQNKSGNDPTGNNLKVIGTKSGRRLQIDDNKGVIEILDADKGGNFIGLSHSKDSTVLMLTSGTDDNNFSTFTMQKESLITIGVKKGGTVILDIELDSNSKKITINSKGAINISADSEINLTSGNINIKASEKLTMEGKKGVEIKGMEIKATADQTVEISSLKTKVAGSAQLDLDGGMLGKLHGAIVQIN